MVTYEFSDIVKKIEIQFLDADKYGYTGKIIDSDDAIDSFIEQRHPTLGRCYTFRPETEIQQIGVDSMKFEL